MDFEKEFHVIYTFNVLIATKTIGYYVIELEAGADSCNQYASPNRDNLPINDYTHFFMTIYKDGSDYSTNLDSDEIRNKYGVDVSPFIRIAGKYFGMVPKELIETIINNAIGNKTTTNNAE